jgi:hypothetical protein
MEALAKATIDVPKNRDGSQSFLAQVWSDPGFLDH